MLTVDLVASSRCFLDFFLVRRRCFCSERFLSDFTVSPPLVIALFAILLFNADLFATSATISANLMSKTSFFVSDRQNAAAAIYLIHVTKMIYSLRV